MGVPAGNRSPDVASVKTMENVPVTERLSFIVSVHVVAVPPQAPPQPLNRAWLPGVAVSVTVAPTLKLAEQLDPQVIPAGLLVTTPAAEPRVVTVSVTEIGANVAMTVVAAVSVSVQVPVPLHPPPLHPAKTDPAAAVGVSVTVVPLLWFAWQDPPQLSPDGDEVTVLLRLRARLTVTVNCSEVNAAHEDTTVVA